MNLQKLCIPISFVFENMQIVQNLDKKYTKFHSENENQSSYELFMRRFQDGAGRMW